MFCTQCGSQAVNRSHRRGALDWMLSLNKVHPHRCSECDARFYAGTPLVRDRPPVKVPREEDGDFEPVAVSASKTGTNGGSRRKRSKRNRGLVSSLRSLQRHSKGRWKRIALQAFVYVAALVAFLVILQQIIKERVPAE